MFSFFVFFFFQAEDGIRAATVTGVQTCALPISIQAAGLGDPHVLRRAKQMGFADRRIAELTGTTEREVRAARLAAGIRATFKMVDTCAAEFTAYTPYL